MNTVFSFIFDPIQLHEFALPRLEEYYDTDYCVNKVFKGLKKKHKKLEKIVKKIRQKSTTEQ